VTFPAVEDGPSVSIRPEPAGADQYRERAPVRADVDKPDELQSERERSDRDQGKAEDKRVGGSLRARRSGNIGNRALERFDAGSCRHVNVFAFGE
jgi:hypothetical protein